MVKTTLYLPEELKAELERVAQMEQRSEADVIREALAELLRRRTRPKPRLGLGASDDQTLASRVDEALEGFGEQ
ncbi:MAG TPA: CopG family transcriptional regulator [Egibacteraceae bacterium]|nr:CopG family transcriptional regulator [Egibacteraceae bacterium]